jgi:RNA polymerase sigma-70 factor (ECF subfamily)
MSIATAPLAPVAAYEEIAASRMTTNTTRKVRSSMSTTTLRTERGLRCAADHLESGPARSGFRRRASLDRSIDSDPLIPRAVSRAKLGDRDALRYLYLRFSDHVYSYVRTIVRDDHEAEDVTQHVFAKLIRVVGKYEQRGTPFSGWILRLAHNVAIDHVRVRRPVPAEEIFGEGERGDDNALERSRCLRDALDTLPEEQREVVVLRHVIGLSPSEIAERLGRTESSIHGLHHRGRRALREELIRMEAAPLTAAA